MKYHFILTFFMIFNFSNCQLYKVEDKSISLQKLYQNHFKLGVAFDAKHLKNKKIESIVAKHFNVFTPENDFKPEKIISQNSKYTFHNADLLHQYSKSNGLKFRGHTLVWHQQTPDFFFRNKKGILIDKEVLYTRLYRYMNKIMKKYGTQVYAWDVVNEAIADAKEKSVYRIKKSNWYQICGAEFIEVAFKMARDIDSNAKLFYNDYGLLDPVKQDRLISFLKTLKEKNVPIDGVGVQAHWYIDTNPDKVNDLLERIKALGLKIHITELDVSIYSEAQSNDKKTKQIPFTIDLSKKQAKLYKALFEVFMKHADAIELVSFWGVSDKDSWLNYFPVKNRRNNPLLFDDRYQPKMAFDELVKLAQNYKSNK